MGNHILPRVLLRGFSINNSKDYNKLKVMVFTPPESIITGYIKDLFQEKDFYSGSVETMLDKKFENPFGQIKKRMIQEFNEEKKKFCLSDKEYLNLVKFIVVMWRRSNTQLEILKSNLEHFINDEKMKYHPLYNKKSLDDFFKENKKGIQDFIYNYSIPNTNENDPTVQKMIKDYIPIIIVNETNINFPLHNKYSSIQNIGSNNKEYPELTIEPISNRIFIIFVKYINHGIINKNNEFDVIYLKSSEEVEALMKLYIIKNISNIVVDNTNIEFVKKTIKDLQNNITSLKDVQVLKLLLKVYERF